MGRKLPRRPMPDDFELPPDPDEETIASIVDQFGPGDLQIKVYKIKEGSPEYCTTLGSPAEANEEHIRGLGYGAGKFLLKIIIDGVFKKSIPIAIAEKQGSGSSGGESQIMKMMMEQMNRMEQRLSAAPREPLSELASAMAQLQGMMPKPQELTPDTILKWIEVGKEIGGGASGGDSFTGMLKEIAPAALQALVRARGNGGMAGHIDSPPSNEAEAKMFAEMRLKMGIAFLKKKCLAGSDPLLYLEMILDNRDEAEFQQLIHACLTSDFSAFVQIDPTINDEPFEPFFRAIYDGIRSPPGANDSVDDNSTGKGGDHGDFGNNGTTGKKRGK